MMTINNHNSLLHIHPSTIPSETPVIDEITRKMTAALHGEKEEGMVLDGRFLPHVSNFSSIVCSCGVSVAATDFRLPNGFLTNSMAVHWLAYHRADIPSSILDAISRFRFGEQEPRLVEMTL